MREKSSLFFDLVCARRQGEKHRTSEEQTGGDCVLNPFITTFDWHDAGATAPAFHRDRDATQRRRSVKPSAGEKFGLAINEN